MKNLTLAVLMSASALAGGMPAFAQTSSHTGAPDAPEDSASETDAIIVTARRRDEDVQQVPLVVNTVSSEAIGRLNLQNFTEVQSLVPGLQLRSESNGLGGSAQIRGVGYDTNSSAQPTVEFYLNDAPITAAYVLQQMYDISQIEVQRGPQGTLRGRSSPSGSITVTTKKPDLNEIGGYVSMSGSDIGTINFNGAVGLPIIEGVLGIRVAGVVNESEGNRVKTITNALDGRDPVSRTKGGRISAVFAPLDWLRVEGNYQRLDSDQRVFDQYASYSLVDPTGAIASPRLIRPSDRLSIQESPREISQKYDVYNWRGEARLAGQVLVYQGQRATSKINSVSNLDFANLFIGRDQFQTTDSSFKTTSHEVRLQNEERLFGVFDYVWGYFHQESKSNTELTTETAIRLPARLGGALTFTQQTNIDTDTQTEENSFFGNVSAHIGDKLQLSAGARHIHFEQPANTLTVGTSVLPGALAVNDKKWIYNASAQYFVTPDVMVYASTGTSRRPGPTIIGNFSPVTSERTRDFTYLPSEDSTSYEIGLKSSFFDNRVRANITGFHQTFKNYPYKLTGPVYYQSYTFVAGSGLSPGVAAGAAFAAAVPVEVNGVEAELGFKVTPQFDISVVASYALGKIKNGVVPCDDINGDGIPDQPTSAPSLAQVQAAYGADLIGACSVSQRASAQAPFSTTLMALYNVPISNTVEAFTRGLFNFQGKSQGDPVNGFDSVDAYGLLNMFAGLRDSRGAWEVNFFVKNVFDTVKATTFNTPAATAYQELQPPTFRTTVGRTFTSPYSVITTTPPREFGLNFRYAFGSR